MTRTACRSLPNVLCCAEREGYVAGVNAEQIGRATMILGAGRDKVEDAVDPAVGALMKAGRGDHVRAGDVLVEIHYREDKRLEQAVKLFRDAWRIEEEKPVLGPLVLESIE